MDKKLSKNEIIEGDCLEKLKELPDESVDMIITSPPYYKLKDYNKEKQIGQENSFNKYLQRLLKVTKECQKILKSDGTLWWIHNDSYSSSGNKERVPRKSLMMQPYRLAQKMIDDQKWILRNIIIWHKPSCMPESVTDRFTVDYEPVLFFSKNQNYYFKQQFEEWKDKRENDVKRAKNNHQGYKGKNKNGQSAGGRGQPLGNPDKGRNKRSIWSINPSRSSKAHFAVFPEELIKTPIRAGCPKDGVVLDPFLGTGTTAVVAQKLGRDYIGIELNSDYIEMAENRLAQKELL